MLVSTTTANYYILLTVNILNYLQPSVAQTEQDLFDKV